MLAISLDRSHHYHRLGSHRRQWEEYGRCLEIGRGSRKFLGSVKGLVQGVCATSSLLVAAAAVGRRDSHRNLAVAETGY